MFSVVVAVACPRARWTVTTSRPEAMSQEAKSRGWVRMEGKEYVMADGDVVEFRFNV